MSNQEKFYPELPSNEPYPFNRRAYYWAVEQLKDLWNVLWSFVGWSFIAWLRALPWAFAASLFFAIAADPSMPIIQTGFEWTFYLGFIVWGFRALSAIID